MRRVTLKACHNTGTKAQMEETAMPSFWDKTTAPPYENMG